MPAIATAPAARAFPREGAIPISVLWNTRAGRSVLTVRRQNAYIILIINAMRSTWISEAAAPVIAGRRPAQRSGRREAFPQTMICCSNSCRHDLRNKFGLAELLVNRLLVLCFYITIDMLDASRLACVLVSIGERRMLIDE